MNIMAEDKAKNDRIQVSMTMYTQQVEYMNQLDNPIDSYSAETVAKDIAKRLEAADIKTKYIATIMHDSDTLEVWNPKTAVYDLEPKENHYHSVIKFETRVDLDKVAKAIGDGFQNFEKPNKGRYAEENMLAYLTHSKSPSKWYYSPDEVYTLGVIGAVKVHNPEADGSYKRYYNEHKSAWDKFRATRKVEEHKVSVNQIKEMVLNFKISREALFLNPEYFDVYTTDMSTIDKAFQARLERRFYQLKQEFDSGKFDLTTIYIHGDSGKGKTTAANTICQELINRGEEVYSAGSANPFDDYTGESVVVIDDVKLNTLTPDEWLRLLDPINFSPLSARYKNKKKAMKTVIITGIQDVREYFGGVINHVKGYNLEPLEQFVRRISVTCKVVDRGQMKIGMMTYDGESYNHSLTTDVIDFEEGIKHLVDIVDYNANDEHARTHSTMTYDEGVNFMNSLGIAVSSQSMGHLESHPGE